MLSNVSILVDSMPSKKVNERYEDLLQIYRDRGYRNPALSLNYDVEKLRSEGKTRDEAILALHDRELKQVHIQKEAQRFAQQRLKELQKELEDLRNSVRNRADEVESIKKYLAYTHRLTTSQVIARVLFYVMGAALVILSFFQYHTLTTYIVAASGYEWVFILDCFVTFSLGLATIALGWVLESMARSRPVF